MAATLERRWNDALNQLQETQKKSEDFLATHARATTPQQQEEILSLARDLPRFWKSPTTQAKDRKRMVRLLVKDITIQKGTQPKQLLAQIRWQGGATETLVLDLPPAIADRLPYPDPVVARVRELAATLPHDEIAATLNRESCRSSKGKTFTVSMIRWIRFRHKIAAAGLPLTIGSTVIDEDVRGGRKPTRIGIDLVNPAEKAVIRLAIQPVTKKD